MPNNGLTNIAQFTKKKKKKVSTLNSQPQLLRMPRQLPRFE